MIRTRLLAAAMLAAGLVTLAACASSAKPAGNAGGAPSQPATGTTSPATGPSSAAAAPSTPPAAAGKVSCDWEPAQAGNPYTVQTGNPPASVPNTGTATMTIVTNQGTIAIKMDRAKTPCTVASFAYLAGKKFFDKSTCHRLTTQGIFVLQCGDPSGTGEGGPSYTIPDENLTGATYPAGTVAMANTGAPHSGNSQFFLNYKDSPLPPSYAPFGTVTAGLDVLTKIGAAGDDESNGPGDGKPKLPVNISSITVK